MSDGGDDYNLASAAEAAEAARRLLAAEGDKDAWPAVPDGWPPARPDGVEGVPVYGDAEPPVTVKTLVHGDVRPDALVAGRFAERVVDVLGDAADLLLGRQRERRPVLPAGHGGHHLSTMATRDTTPSEDAAAASGAYPCTARSAEATTSAEAAVSPQ